MKDNILTFINLTLKRITIKLIHFFSPILPDKIFIMWSYYVYMGKKIDLKNPQTFNEKLNWLKLYDKNSLYTKLVDKYEVKKYIAKSIGDEYIIPTIGVWNTVEDIQWDTLPNQFVLKTTHGGGNTGVIICKDKSKLDIRSTCKKLKKSLKQDLYKTSKEWPYKNVRKRIIAEPYIEDDKTKELRDYKFFCFNGEVKCLFIASERQKRREPFFDFFDEDFNLLPIKQGHPNSLYPPHKPVCFEEMKMLARILSKGIPHVRVDFYEVNERVLFGELTFYHFGAVVPFEPEEWDYVLGKYIDLDILK